MNGDPRDEETRNQGGTVTNTGGQPPLPGLPQKRDVVPERRDGGGSAPVPPQKRDVVGGSPRDGRFPRGGEQRRDDWLRAIMNMGMAPNMGGQGMGGMAPPFFPGPWQQGGMAPPLFPGPWQQGGTVTNTGGQGGGFGFPPNFQPPWQQGGTILNTGGQGGPPGAPPYSPPGAAPPWSPYSQGFSPILRMLREMRMPQPQRDQGGFQYNR